MSKPTHILIPIAEFNLIDDSEGYIDQASKDGDIALLVARGKRISLSEEDIEEKVKEATNKHNLNGWEQTGYKQALKDLL